MRQLHYTHSAEQNTITLHHPSGDTITIPIRPETLKNLNEYSQTVPNPQQLSKLQAINAELLQRYSYVDAQKFNTSIRKKNVEIILEKEQTRFEILKNIIQP